MKAFSEARVAIVNDWLIQYTGSERLLVALLEIFPDADLYALNHDPEAFRNTPLENRHVRTSLIQALPGNHTGYRSYLPLMPTAVERFDLSAYDIVISSSHAVAKGAITTPDQLHICYLHARNLKYAYEDRFLYPRNKLSGLAQDLLLTGIRVWDKVASTRPDFTISNSRYVRNWHLHRHGIDSTVVYPPVDTHLFFNYFERRKEDYYVTVGRLEPYKRPDVMIKAFNNLGRRLLVIGDGSMYSALRRMAAPNIEFLGRCSSETVAQTVSRARAFVFASREDFGIAPLEAQACGTPVIAYRKGGARETIVGWPDTKATGLFFGTQTPPALEAAVRLFEAHEFEFEPDSCMQNVERFSRERFRCEFTRFTNGLWNTFQNSEEMNQNVHDGAILELQGSIASGEAADLPRS